MARSSGARTRGPVLADAKLAPPRQRGGLVDRPRILAALDQGRDRDVTLVAAPVGYGKTTAVSTWCEARTPPLAWVTLDAGDNDPARLWRYVATAVDRVREGLGRTALQHLRQATSITGPVDELMNGISAHAEGVVIVLDDLHTVTDAECLASIGYAIEHLPSSARLFLISRSTPSLRLATLRARGALLEVRADELSFTSEEVHELLVARGAIDLGADEVGVLFERTEGWPAGILLASLWLQSVANPRDAVRHFGADQRFIAEYLSYEVLQSLDDDVRSFLLGASVLGQFTADLCAEVLGYRDARQRLADLERSNLFVSQLDHGWYRIHSLFAAFAAFELASSSASAPADIHVRAARWLRERGMAVEAVGHAHAAGEHDLVAEILKEQHLAVLRTGGERTLLRWVATLPDEQLLANPELPAVAALSAELVGHHTSEMRRFLALTSRGVAQRTPGSSPYAEAVGALVRAASLEGGVAAAVEAGRTAVDLCRTDADEGLVAALGAYARALYFAGRADEAWSAALEAVQHPEVVRRIPGHAFARTTLALIAIDRKHVESARQHADVAAALVASVGSATNLVGASTAAALGVVLAEEGDLVGAERELLRAQRFHGDDHSTVHSAWLSLLIARTRTRRGRLAEADKALASASGQIAELADGGIVKSLEGQVRQEIAHQRARAENGEGSHPPSRAERAVLELLASELSTREMAAQLFLSPNTVRSHTRAIYRKLGVSSRGDAVARADALGLLAQSPR